MRDSVSFSSGVIGRRFLLPRGLEPGIPPEMSFAAGFDEHLSAVSPMNFLRSVPNASSTALSPIDVESVGDR